MILILLLVGQNPTRVKILRDSAKATHNAPIEI